MKIQATNKGKYECAPITLGAIGLTGEQTEKFLLGESITVNKDIAEVLIKENLATNEVNDGSDDI